MPLPYLAIAALALQGGSMLSGINGSKEAKKNAKDKAAHDAAMMTAATELQVESILNQKDEAQKSAVQKMSDMARAAAIERGRILAGAGEAGVAGGSVSQQLLASYQHEAESRGREMYNLKTYKRQANLEIAQAQAGLQVNMPKYENTGASTTSQLLAGAVGALQIYQQFKPPK